MNLCSVRISTLVVHDSVGWLVQVSRDSYRNFGLGRERSSACWGGGGFSVIFPVKKKAYLMKIAIEGPDLSAVNFDAFLNKRTGKSDCRLYSCVRIIVMNFLFWGFLGWEI